jgi:(1->4)-alpha-D-glucan 1-alpha-D-glucosylmutase
MLYQTLVGAWPVGLDELDRAARADFVERVAAWQHKALREAKRRTSWTDPDPRYERACAAFLRALFERSEDGLGELERFAQRIGPAGALNGLVQVLLRCTTPGVPDLYQGCEYWDLSLVDPDNRRPVDHAARARTLRDGGDVSALAARWRDARVKQALLARVLRWRRRCPDVFALGRYVPLQAEGPMREHVLAFSREHDGVAVIVIVALHVAAHVDDRLQTPARIWTGTHVHVGHVAKSFNDVISGASCDASNGSIPLDRVFAALPLAMLEAA